MNAAAWFYRQGFHSSTQPEKPQPTHGPRVGDLTVVDRWNGSGWTEVTLRWDGEKYAEVTA